MSGWLDPIAGQEMLGHADVSTTEICTHVDGGCLRQTHKSFRPRGKADPMRRRSMGFLALCTLPSALAACQPEAPIVGRLATEAEKDAMPGFLVALDRREITILTPLQPALPGCEVELDQRWRAVIPPQADPDIVARVPLSDFRDDAGRPPRGNVTRVEVTCPGESGPLRYTARKTGSAPTSVTPWIFPDE